MNDNTTITQPEMGEAMPMNLNVRVRPIAPKDNLIGFASVTINNCFVIDGIKVCSGANGLYVNMPSMQDASGKWRDICKPLTSDFRKQLTDAVVEGYGAAIEKMQATVDAAAKGAPEKPSLTGALKESADKVKTQPVRASTGKNEQAL